MKRLFAVLAPVLAVGVLATEMAMDLDAGARTATYWVYAAATLLAVVLFAVVQWWTPRARSLSQVVALVGVSTVSVAALAVVLAANSMFFSGHDRDLLLVTVGVGGALAAGLATTVGRSVSSDLRRVQTTAQRVGLGDLTSRTGVERADEVGQLAQVMDSMIGRLESAEEERKILLASIGHDLRTPLASLRAAIEAVEDGVADDPERYLAGMATDVSYLGRLIDDLFEYARIESGRYVADVQEIDLRELVDESVEVAGLVAVQRSVRLRVEADEGTVVRADPAALRRVLRNLLDNAIRHSPEGGVVTIAVDARGFVVRDEGPGFPDWFKAHAFDRFTRADDARSVGGSGLGLAIARGLVEANHGIISIGDGPGGHVSVAL